MAASLRSLADSKQCRLDMISKGSVDLINTVIPYSDEPALLLCAKALLDILSNIDTLPDAIFDVLVSAATDIMTYTMSVTAWQHVSAMLYTCTQHTSCRKRRLIDRISRCAWAHPAYPYLHTLTCTALPATPTPKPLFVHCLPSNHRFQIHTEASQVSRPTDPVLRDLLLRQHISRQPLRHLFRPREKVDFIGSVIHSDRVQRDRPNSPQG